MQAYPYVGPEAIRERPRGELGAAIGSQQELAAWLAAHSEAAAEGATFVVDYRGVLRVAPRRSEHIDCAGGGAVLAAGELRFAGAPGRPTVAEATNQSTGYCPEPECWEVLAAKLRAAGIPGPQGWSHAFVFRRCVACRQLNVVKDAWFVCDACGAALPPWWNVA